MGRVDGKVALIGGGLRGMGAAHARLLVAEGAPVVMGDILDDQGAALAQELGSAARFVHRDVADPERLFPAGDESSYATGSEFVVDGGPVTGGPHKTS